MALERNPSGWRFDSFRECACGHYLLAHREDVGCVITLCHCARFVDADSRRKDKQSVVSNNQDGGHGSRTPSPNIVITLRDGMFVVPTEP